MASRFIPNNFPELLTLGDTDTHLKSALKDILKNYPPLKQYSGSLEGLWSGPTGIAYLFLHISRAQPHLTVGGHHARTWAKTYIKGSRGSLRLSSRSCGIGDEKLCYDAVAACITKDMSHVESLVSNIPTVINGDYPDEMLYGRAGTLYLLRMVRHWVPDSAELIDDAVAELSQKIVIDGPDWKWHGKRYLGAVHGDIGIVTQLVLGTPVLASRFESTLEGSLDKQLEDGNWPSSGGHSTAKLVQFCHGVTGFVLALLSLREYFPNLWGRIDVAVRKGRECIWRKGLLRKEPCLCHGIFGNALALPSGGRREHFLAVASPERMSEMKGHDQSLFAAANYGKPYNLTTGYNPCAAWAYIVCREETATMIAFNDV